MNKLTGVIPRISLVDIALTKLKSISTALGVIGIDCTAYKIAMKISLPKEHIGTPIAVFNGKSGRLISPPCFTLVLVHTI